MLGGCLCRGYVRGEFFEWCCECWWVGVFFGGAAYAKAMADMLSDSFRYGLVARASKR